MDDNTMGIRPQVDESPTRSIVPDLQSQKGHHKQSLWHKFHDFLGRDNRRQSPIASPEGLQWEDEQQIGQRRDWPTRRVGVGLPRVATFQRQNSEKRERLLPVQPCTAERRAVSASRHTSVSLPRPRATSSPPPVNVARTSAPVVPSTWQFDQSSDKLVDIAHFNEPISPIDLDGDQELDNFRPPRPPSRTSSDDYNGDRFPDLDVRAMLNAELESKWILNLSMHFRDKSDREKFFVTYAEQPNRWRRVTVSCDYRNAEPGSLEMDLKELRFQRDKSLQIYESIRDSLPDIQFYDTVTNLKLETSGGRLHVHVTEDLNEIIPYPPKSTVAHILEDEGFKPMEVLESELVFDLHLSGFVYKVNYDGKTYIKKEIPGPDTVDEFLYEINALHALHGSRYVIQLEAIVVDDSRQSVRGLLISFAERGAVVDLLYDHKGDIAWIDRVRWAQQAVQGLSEIHEEGYVQGDFTLSNIVVDQNNNAQIIDINRRGCPVGWEPPEIAKKIASNQRISMYIGEKSDIYQLGMTLWALAMDDDEPERHDPPLSTDEFPLEVPEWYQDIVRTCLAAEPRDRLSAKEVLQLFQAAPTAVVRPLLVSRISTSGRTEREYIDPEAAVERDDIERLSRNQTYQNDLAYTSASSFDDYTFTYPRSSNSEFESGGSQIERPRGRRPQTNAADTNNDHQNQRKLSEDEFSPLDTVPNETHIATLAANQEPQYDKIDIDGPPDLLPKGVSGSEQIPPLEQGEEHSAGPIPAADPSDMTPHELNANQVTEHIELDPPLDASSASGTSDSTPRNTQSVLASSVATMPSSLALDLSLTDLAGFGGHPSLDEHSPHEPKTMRDLMSSPPNETPEELRITENAPPKLPFADSGYDEMSDFSQRYENFHPTDREKSPDHDNRVSARKTFELTNSLVSLELDKDTEVGMSEYDESSPPLPTPSDIDMALPNPKSALSRGHSMQENKIDTGLSSAISKPDKSNETHADDTQAHPIQPPDGNALPLTTEESETQPQASHQKDLPQFEEPLGSQKIPQSFQQHQEEPDIPTPTTNEIQTYNPAEPFQSPQSSI